MSKGSQVSAVIANLVKEDIEQRLIRGVHIIPHTYNDEVISYFMPKIKDTLIPKIPLLVTLV